MDSSPMQLHPKASYSSDAATIASFLNASSNHPHVCGELANGGMNMNMNMNMMGVCGKGVFTSSQLEELERQKMIHKYILATLPVPPHLLPQCNTLAAPVDFRYSSNGSDPEPWRCKRTDGKKWRCSRDVAPDQKYCERHAHKNRPRSRKHVENSHKPFLLPSNHPPSTPQFPTIASAYPYDQTRCIEWLMRGGNSDATCARKQQQWEQQLMQMSSSKMEANGDNINKISDNNHVSVYHYHQLYGDKQDLMSDAILNSDTTQAMTTRVFIDAWGKEGVVEGMASKEKLWPPPPPSSSSLSLSMCGDEKGRDGDGLLNNPMTWMNNSPPGGPLGEALCLGNANTRGGGGSGGGSDMASPHGYGNSNGNRSSCSHAINFIG